MKKEAVKRKPMSKPVQEEVFEKYSLKNHHELITEILPKGYNVNASTVDIADIKKYPDKTQVTVYGYIDGYNAKPMTGRKALTRISAKLYRDGQSINLFWITSTMKYKGVIFGLEKQSENKQMVQATGKVSSFMGVSKSRFISLEQPKLVSVGASQGKSSQDPSSFVVPDAMYKLKADMTVFKLKNVFRELIKNFDKHSVENAEEFLPLEIEKKLEMQPLKLSLQYMHGFKPIPKAKFEDFVNYPGFIKRVNAERVWSIIKSAFYTTTEAKKEGMPKVTDIDTFSLKALSSMLPFELTKDQRSTIWNLLQVFVETSGSRSLVFGDVGSGKTMIAMFLSYILYKKGYQVVLMTPTSILSKQHAEEFQEFLGGDADVFLVHSKTKAREKTKINKHLKADKPAIIIGTTSVNSLEYTNVGAVFIDEEQKLGVHAKEKISKSFNNEPHIVYMTATPIPRTLAASIYTNFHVFQVKTKPKNRLARQTSLMDAQDPDRNELDMISKRIANKEQALVIIPSIDSNELANVKGTIAKYTKYFPGTKIKAIHGRLDKKEVEEIIEAYMNGEFEILVATTMVDSGFSNKMLSFVFIENADRFGISQLHQIRGRCGRGELQGHCYLIPTLGKKMKDHTKARLDFVCASEDGFKLSEFDLNNRGSGDLKGTVQSGTELNLIEWTKEIDIMKDYLKRINEENLLNK